MTDFALALCSLFTGASVAAAVFAWAAGGSARRGGGGCDVERILRAAGEGGRSRPGFGARMRWAGLPFGPRALGLGCLCAAAATMWGCASLGLGPGLAGFAACIAGLFPCIAVRDMIVRREQAFAHGVEIIADGIGRGLDSGLGLAESLVLAIGTAPRPVAAALRPAAASALTGQPAQDVAEAFRAAIPIPAGFLLAAALAAGSESGGQVSGAMRSIAASLRDARRGRRRLETAAAEARSASALLMLVPVALAAGLAVIAPSHFALLTGTPSGQAALTFSALWLITGYLILRRMIAAALPADAP